MTARKASAYLPVSIVASFAASLASTISCRVPSRADAPPEIRPRYVARLCRRRMKSKAPVCCLADKSVTNYSHAASDIYSAVAIKLVFTRHHREGDLGRRLAVS